MCRRAASRQYVFEYVGSGAPVGGTIYHIEGICKVEEVLGVLLLLHLQATVEVR